MCEDASRIRKNPGIFARMGSFAYNILRINQSDTIAQDRYAAALAGLKSISVYRISIVTPVGNFQVRYISGSGDSHLKTG